MVVSNALVFFELVLGFIVVITLLAFLYHIYLSNQRKGEPPVRWSWIPLLGFALDMGSRPIELLQECARMHGDIFGMIIGGNRMFIVADPFSTHSIIKGPRELSFDEFTDSILDKFFDIPINVIHKHFTKEFENEMRKMYSHYLLGDKSLHQFTDRIRNHLNKTLLSNDDHYKKKVVPLYDFVSKIVYHASVAALFNEELAADSELYQAFRDHDHNLPLAAAGVHINNFSTSRKGKDRLAHALTNCRDGICDFMSARWKTFSEGPHKLPTDEVIGHLQLAIHWASVGNSMPACFWLIFHLTQNPQYLQRVLDEIHSCCNKKQQQEQEGGDKNRTTNNTISLDAFGQEELNQMLFVDACLTETLRLASGSLIMRVAKSPCTISLSSGKSYNIRKGDRIGLCPPLFHLDDELFPNPMTFNPDRWMQGDSFEERSAAVLGKIPLKKDGKEVMGPNVFLPFGAGVSYCPGRRFSRNEIKLIVIILLSQFQISFVDKDVKAPGVDGSRAGLGVFPPKHDVHVTIQRKI